MSDCQLIVWMQRVWECCQDHGVKRFEDLPEEVRENLRQVAKEDTNGEVGIL